MRTRRSAPRAIDGHEPVPFCTVEEAWFWYVRCQKARRDGARFERGAGPFCRPCDPDDLYRAVKDLTTKRLIRREHVKVLTRFGFAERPPDPRCRGEAQSLVLWDEAMDRLSSVLRSKEIIE